MVSEAPTSSTNLSKMNETSARKIKGARKVARRENRVSEPKAEMAALDVHGAAAAHADNQRESRSPMHNGMILVGGSEVEFLDEEAMFNMPLLLDCMAQGMLLTPPALKKGFTWTDDPIVDFTLWTY